MKSDGNRQLVRDTQGDRGSRMVEACLRISRSFDHKDILQEVIDSARSLTGARYGALVAFDQHGGIEDFFTSGMTEDERRRLRDLPEGRGLLGYLNEVPEPRRLRDLASLSASMA